MFSNIPFPSLFVCFLIFVAWFHYEKHRATRQETKSSQRFWEREEEANRTRKKDISELPMILVDEKDIPLVDTDDENTVYYQKKVRESISRPMMNLSQYTNTDLKLAYGVGNFKTLSDYDENFNQFLTDLSNLGNAYFKTGLYTEAETVFRLCIKTGSDSQRNYKLLGSVYVATKHPEHIAALMREIEESKLPHSDGLLQSLEEMHRTAAL